MLYKEPLNIEEEKYYIEKLQQGNQEARKKLIEHNMRLAASIAKRFINENYEYEDLINTGAIGLIKGIDNFKPEKQIKLCTFCAKCIENEILMYIRRNKIKIQKVNITYYNSSDYEVKDFLPELCDSFNIEESYIESDTLETLKYTLMLLSERDRKILIYHIFYGMSQQDIAKTMNMKQPTISRILKRTFIKLKPYFEAEKLTYLEDQAFKTAKKKYLEKRFNN